MSPDPIALLQQASVFHTDGKIPEAEAGYRRVLSLDPSNADALHLLGLIHHAQKQNDTAKQLIEAAIKLRPSARMFTNLSIVLSCLGDETGSIAAARRAIEIEPGSVPAWSRLIFAVDLDPYTTPALRLADRRAFNARHCAALTREAPTHANDPDPDRRLRVGYVSGDFRHHSAPMVFGPVLEHHTDAVDVTLYHVNADRDDVETERFRRLHTFVDARALSDEQLAEKVREDRIDVLVDLSGYSGGHRVMTFARKPAPVQLTAWGHVTGLGIDAMDYILADAWAIPPEHEDRYHERILRIPCHVAYRPPQSPPPATPPPVEQNGVVTFGYLGRPHKTNATVYRAWVEILHRVPGSVLVLKHGEWHNERLREDVGAFFLARRIGPDRLHFLGGADHANHLEAYSLLDVALESFPQCGGVTTLEACLMGVPSVGLWGDYINGRVAGAILETLGCGQWVAGTVEEYVDLAVSMARRPASLDGRLALRRTLLDSPICDHPTYVQHVERAYRQAWAAWCRQQKREEAA